MSSGSLFLHGSVEGLARRREQIVEGYQAGMGRGLRRAASGK